MKKPFYLQLKKRVFNALILLVALSSVAALCDPEDLSFTVSKLMDNTYEVSLTAADDDGTGTLSGDKSGIIDLKNSEEFQEYKDDMTVSAVNEMYAVISPADGETEIIGTGDISRLAFGFMDINGGEELVKFLVNTDPDFYPQYTPLYTEPVTLQSLNGVKLDIKDLFTQVEIDKIIETFNTNPTVAYRINYDVAGAAPVKFKVTYFIDISAGVTPL